MDKFESIRAFIAVVDQGGFAAAARVLDVSRSAVNKLVINLENELGVQLLHRTTRQVSPTETGMAFYERCQRILADLEEAELAVTQMHEEPRGNLKINAPMSFGILHLSRAVAEFTAQYPDLRVQLTLDDRFVDPIEEGYDLIVRISEAPESPSLVVHPVAPVRRVLCASPQYLEQHGQPQHPADLKQHSCLHYGAIASSSSNAWRLTEAGEERTIPIIGALCSNNGEVLRDAAIQGLGIALLPTFIVCDALRQGHLQVVLPHCHPPDISAWIVYPLNRHLSTKVQVFVQFLQDRFGDRPAWDAGY